MGLLDVLLVILIILASALCVYLIITLRNVNRNLDVLQRDLSEINNRLLPILNNLQEVSDKVLNLAEEVETQLNKVQTFVSSTKSKLNNIGSFNKKNPESRIINFVKNLTAVSKAITAFINEFKNNNTN